MIAWSILAFNNKLYWVGEGMSVGEDRTKAESLIKRLRASGGTALYDAIAGAYTHLMEPPAENRIAAVVVLTDGKDTNRKLKLPDLLGQIAVSETSTVRVFPIGYGSQVNQAVMQQIAESTKVNAYQGDPANIQKIFFDISTYF